jgi:ribosomal protein S18 acetylase RimI-like enzyme
MTVAISHPSREAETGDRPLLVRTFAAAFQDDPVMSFIFPDPNDRRKRLPLLFAILYNGDGAHGARFMTPNHEAGTLWRAPGMGHLSILEKLQHGLPWLRAAGFSLGRALAVSAASDAAHPREPHWYLHIVGCHPGFQGRGFGTAAIVPGLMRADRQGVPAYLETANENNIGFYQRLGFHISHEWSVPKGPRHWSMTRPPRAELPDDALAVHFDDDTSLRMIASASQYGGPKA